MISHIFSIIMLLSILLVLSNNRIQFAEGKKRKKVRPSTDDEEEIKFNSQKDLDNKLQDLNRERQRKMIEEKMSPSERLQLENEEEELKKDVLRAVLNHGEFSRERAAALHAYGRNVYKQGKYDDVLQLAKDIVKIHEHLDGVDDIQTASALGNVGSVAFRLGLTALCEAVMKRAINIIIETHGIDSKEVLLHRGKMLTFQVSDAEETDGIDFEDYESAISQLEKSSSNEL